MLSIFYYNLKGSVTLSCTWNGCFTQAWFYNIMHWSFRKYWFFDNSYTDIPNVDMLHYTISENHICSCHHAATAAKSLQSCSTLCDPRDSSPPGSPVPGILKARTLEWVAISFSNAWKWKVKVKSLSCVQLFATPWTAVCQAPPSMGFSRQGYWSGVPLPSPHVTIDLIKKVLSVGKLSGSWWKITSSNFLLNTWILFYWQHILLNVSLEVSRFTLFIFVKRSARYPDL